MDVFEAPLNVNLTEWVTEAHEVEATSDGANELNAEDDEAIMTEEEYSQDSSKKKGEMDYKQEEYRKDYKRRLPPPIEEALAAKKDLDKILHPPRKSGYGYMYPKLGPLLKHQLTLMRSFLAIYVDPNNKRGWNAASIDTIRICDTGRKTRKNGRHAVRRLRQWTRAFIRDREDLPFNNYGAGNASIIEDEDLHTELLLHLQGIGKYVKAMDVVEYMKRPNIKQTYGLTDGISLPTAQRWMHRLGYRWRKTPKGQYVDEHEREDIVAYRQTTFIPTMAEYLSRMRNWSEENPTIEQRTPTVGKRVVIWHHDESVFYANDRRHIRWVHQSEKPVPCAKGEGASLMAADFISADYGWLSSPDGRERAQVLFKPGKHRDGYFDSEDIIHQTETAMDIIEKYFPDEEHLFLFDNATTHTKRADDALSARKMPKFTPPPGKNWGVSVTERDSNGNIIHNNAGKPNKVIQRMSNAQLPNGDPQLLYFPEGHPRAGVFKGMAIMLEERGLFEESKLKTECKGFKCAPGQTNCCVRRVLYNQPDFIQVKSLLEEACEKRNFKVLFLPKFHCELNFIEQCWGYAKRIYRQYPPSKDEATLEKNVLSALESIPLVTIRKFVQSPLTFVLGTHP